MKKVILLFVLLFVIVGAKAQTYLKINHDYYYNSVVNNYKYCCYKDFDFNVSLHGIAHGYNQANDSIVIKVSYGDGTQSQFKTNIYNDSLFNMDMGSFQHTYTNLGLVDVKIYAIAPDLKADSIIKNNFLVGDSCANIGITFYLDSNMNCQKDTTESPFIATDVKLWYNNIDITDALFIMTSIQGLRDIRVPVDFEYDVTIANNLNGIFCPAVMHISTIPSYPNWFGLQCINGIDITGNLIGGGTLTQASIYPWCGNYGCAPANNVQMKLIFDTTMLTPDTSSIVYTVSEDTIIINAGNLPSIIFIPLIPVPGVLPVINFIINSQAQIGDSICFTLLETPFAGDIDTTNNIQHRCFVLASSWDPNDKQVTPQGESAAGNITNNQIMIYNIRFQNTGNAPAENVYIIDSLDSNLEIGTFVVMNVSHAMTYDFIAPHVVKFNFPSINLPDSGTNMQGSNGFVTYAIRQKPNLPAATTLKNTAYIYFDSNPAVVTNTTLNTIISLAGLEENNPEQSQLLIYPNPSTGLIHLSFAETAKDTRVEVMNSCGQLVSTKTINNQTQTTIDLTSQAKGMYFIKVQNGSGVVVRKVVISE